MYRRGGPHDGGNADGEHRHLRRQVFRCHSGVRCEAGKIRFPVRTLAKRDTFTCRRYLSFIVNKKTETVNFVKLIFKVFFSKLLLNFEKSLKLRLKAIGFFMLNKNNF